MSSLGVNIATSLPLFCPPNPILGQEVLKTHANMKQSYICLKCTRIANIFVSFRKSGSRNTMVTSDFRPEVEIQPFHALHAQWKIRNITLTYGWIDEISASFRKLGSRNTIQCLWHKPARGYIQFCSQDALCMHYVYTDHLWSYSYQYSDATVAVMINERAPGECRPRSRLTMHAH